MPQQNIAVIGAGPKAAAIAAKAYCLQHIGKAISVTVFERSEIGSHWTGRNGYTDGDQRLCTPAERDLGFPYLKTFGGDVAGAMQNRFSWSAYLVSQADMAPRYADWVNRGRRPPSHADFAGYLAFALERAEVGPVYAKVTEVEPVDDTWTIRAVAKESGETLEYDDFHGVVITGPGPASKKPRQVRDKRVLSGVSFWSHLKQVRRMAESLNKDAPIVIIGGGGTAAAITAWFIRQGLRKQPIALINNQAMLFTRTTNFFENSLFDDEDTWLALSPGNRTDFTRRLNRGVVWETVTQLLSDAENLTLLPGKALDVRYAAGTADLEVEYQNEKGKHPLAAGLVIDATGFDPWAFRKIFPPAFRDQMATRGQQGGLMAAMHPDLSLPIAGAPRIHVPGAADALGPGFGSLMVLGAMADRILQPYYDRA